MIHLEGPREERTHEQARARIPLSAAQARHIVDQLETKTKSKAARLSFARNVLVVGNLSPEAREVYREYGRLLEASA